jgi:hypothetical protein
MTIIILEDYFLEFIFVGYKSAQIFHYALIVSNMILDSNILYIYIDDK